MNKDLKEALDIYFQNIDNVKSKYKRGDEFANIECYKSGFKKASLILRNIYNGKYTIKYDFMKGRSQGVIEPKIFIKKNNNDKNSARDGIYIYVLFGTSTNERTIEISLEIGRDDRYENHENNYKNNVKLIKDKYNEEIKKLEKELKNIDDFEIISTNECILKIKIKNVTRIVEFINAFTVLYDKVIEDIIEYKKDNNLWEQNWEEFQKEVFQETYIEKVRKNNILNNNKNDQNDSFNHIYYGVPGCGKSKHIELEYGLNENNFTRITFHPDYTNSDFIGQIVPKKDKKDDTKIHYDFEAGPFTVALKNALLKEKDNEPYYLVIEEINRGNASAIFGDIFQILDRKENGESEYQIDNYAITDYLSDELKKTIKKVYLPSNLYILATMNTNDQNVYPLDTAFKRRWDMHLITNEFNNKIDYDKKISKMLVPGTNYSWEEFVTKINEVILEKNKYQVNNEDKQIGKYFVSSKELVTKEDEPQEISLKARRFGEKVLMYIWEDIAKINLSEWFSEYESYEKLLKAFNNNSQKIIDDLIGTNKDE